MSIWQFIPLGWVAISAVLYICSVVILAIRNHSLSRLIKALDYELWKKYRFQACGAFQFLAWPLFPLWPPKEVSEAFENNVAFETKRRKAVKGYITALVLFANVNLAIVLCIVVWALL